MATPIKQHTIESYNIYSIIYGNTESSLTKAPLNPRYLIPLLKNDARLIASYSGDIIKSIEDYQYANIGGLEFTITIEVVENEMSIEKFINDVLFMKYDYRNYESITKLLSIAACSKGLLLSVLYMLYFADENNNRSLIELEFLNKVDTLQPIDLYNFVLSEMNKLLLVTNPIDVENYIPTIEVEEMDTYATKDNPSITYNFDSDIKLSNKDDYSNLRTFVGEKVRIKNLSNVTVKERSWTDLFDADINIGNILQVNKVSGSDRTWNAKLGKFPTKELVTIKGTNITNNTKNLVLTFKKGFTYAYENNTRVVKNDVLEKAIRIRPGETKCLNKYVENVIRKNTNVYLEKTQTMQIDKYKFDWHDDLFEDTDSGAIEVSGSANNTKSVKLLRSNDLLGLEWTDTNSVTTVKNNLSNTTFIFPAGYKYHYTSQLVSNKTVIVQVQKTIEELVVNTIVTFVTVVSTVWNWFLGLFQTKEEKKRVEETVVERVKRNIIETQERIEQITTVFDEEVTLTKAIIVKPGESATFPKAKKYNGWKLKLIDRQTITANKNIKKSKNTTVINVGNTATPIDFKTEILLDSSTADFLTIDSTHHKITFTTKVEYTDFYEMKDYKADAIFEVTQANLTYKDLLSMKKQDNITKMFSKITESENAIAYYNNKDTTYSMTPNSTTFTKVSYDKVLKLNVDSTVDQQGTVTAKTYSFDSSFNSLKLEPPNYDNSNTISIHNNYVMNFTKDITNYTLMYNKVISYLLSLPKKAVVDDNYLPDVLYHINKVLIHPTFSLNIIPYYYNNLTDKLVNNTGIRKDLSLNKLLDIVNTNFIPSTTKTILNNDSKLLLSHTSYSFTIPKSSTSTFTFTDNSILSLSNTNTLSHTFDSNTTFSLDISSANLYYYNGSIYKK